MQSRIYIYILYKKLKSNLILQSLNFILIHLKYILLLLQHIQLIFQILIFHIKLFLLFFYLITPTLKHFKTFLFFFIIFNINQLINTLRKLQYSLFRQLCLINLKANTLIKNTISILFILYPLVQLSIIILYHSTSFLHILELFQLFILHIHIHWLKCVELFWFNPLELLNRQRLISILDWIPFFFQFVFSTRKTQISFLNEVALLPAVI